MVMLPELVFSLVEFAHFLSSQYFSELRRFINEICSRYFIWLVGDGWEFASILWGNLWSKEPRFFDKLLPWFDNGLFFAFIVHSFLKEFISGLNLGSFVLMGHSLGGYLCGRFLMKYPESGIKGLILLSAAGLRPHPPEENQIPPSELDNSRLRWIMSFWAANYTPQSLVRMFGENTGY